MNRIEFVDTLRTTLVSEMPRDKVEENVHYYNNYILSMGDEDRQQEEIDRIGDPHLIAQTIIDAYKMSEPYKYEEQTKGDYQQSAENDVDDFSKQEKGNLWSKVKKVVITTCIILVLVALLRVAFGLFIRIGIPIIVVYILFRIFNNSGK